MKTLSALLALAAISAVTSTVSTSPLVERDIDPQYSLYAQCIQEALPKYPYGDEKPTAAKVGECFARIEAAEAEAEAAAVKRSTITDEPDFNKKSPSITDNINLTIRDNNALWIKGLPYCDNDEVNDHFIWVTEIRSKAVDTCARLIKEINDNGLTEDGGVGQVVNIFTNGHDKQGHQLKDNMKVAATFILKIYRPAGMAFETVKEVSEGVSNVCAQALTLLATKEEGCTADLNYYRPSKARGYTGTGAIGGMTHIMWKDALFAALKLDLANA